MSRAVKLESAPYIDRRRFLRLRAYKGAQICFHRQGAAIDCIVRDSSDAGARLTVESPLGIPDRFELMRKGLPPTPCRVIWRRASQIGVEFFAGD